MIVTLLVLVVNDEPDVEVLFRRQFRRELRNRRFTIEFAQSAAIPLERITDAGAATLVLILSDINVPGMSGLELLQRVPKSRSSITAYGDSDTKREAFEGGAEARFTKPIDFALVCNEIETRVQRAA
jgi:CheY-like chemotaxis protein